MRWKMHLSLVITWALIISFLFMRKEHDCTNWIKELSGFLTVIVVVITCSVVIVVFI